MKDYINEKLGDFRADLQKFEIKTLDAINNARIGQNQAHDENDILEAIKLETLKHDLTTVASLLEVIKADLMEVRQ